MDLQTKTGVTALIIARKCNHRQIIKLLQEDCVRVDRGLKRGLNRFITAENEITINVSLNCSISVI